MNTFTLHFADEFVAYEYQDDSMLDLFVIKKVFFIEFILYLIRNNLSSLLELQIHLKSVSESMFELILNQETIMLNETAVHDCSASQQTE